MEQNKTNLNHFNTIANNLNICKKNQIATLHKIIFGNEGDRKNRQRLREFTGFSFKEYDADYKIKEEYIEQNISQPELMSACMVLGLDCNEGDLKATILRNLSAEHFSEDLSDDEEDNEEDDQEDDNNNVDNNEEDQEDERNSDDLSAAGMSISERRPQMKYNNKNTTSHSNASHFNMTFRDVEESISKFDRSKNLSIKTWLEEFEEMASVMCWNNFEKYVVAKKLLTGLASLFIRSKRGVTSWPKLREALIEEFERITNSAVFYKQLVQRKMTKDESIQEYFLHMRELGTRAGIEDEALIEYIIDGINDSTQNKQILYGVSSLNEFKKKLQCYETVHNKKHQEGNNKTQTSKSDTTNNNNKRQKKCFNCGAKGHVSADCRNKDKGVKCFNCNSYGHYAKECQKPSTSINSKVKRVVVKAEKMILNVLVENMSCRAFFDTGSKLNLLSDAIAAKLGTKVEPINVRLVGFGSKDANYSIKSKGNTKCKISIDKEIFDIHFQIVPKRYLDEDCIIGEEFCEEKEITIKDDGVHIKKEFIKVIEKINTTDMPKQPTVREHNTTGEEAEIYSINIQHEEEVDIEGKATPDAKTEVLNLINHYTPVKTKFIYVEMKITLTTETPIYSRPNRLPIAERQIVDEQIAE